MATIDRTQRLGIALVAATAFAIPFEGFRQYAYYDPPGVLTVCYGSTVKVEKGRKYALEECRERLDAEMREALEYVERCVPGLPPNKLAAWGDAVYNLGPRIVCDLKASTAARLLAAKQWDEACAQLPRWNKARVAGALVELPGLTRRRTAEMQLCLEDTLA